MCRSWTSADNELPLPGVRPDSQMLYNENKPLWIMEVNSEDWGFCCGDFWRSVFPVSHRSQRFINSNLLYVSDPPWIYCVMWKMKPSVCLGFSSCFLFVGVVRSLVKHSLGFCSLSFIMNKESSVFMTVMWHIKHIFRTIDWINH